MKSGMYSHSQYSQEKYLGINLMNEVRDLYNENYTLPKKVIGNTIR
jgi:hypothetical protein